MADGKPDGRHVQLVFDGHPITALRSVSLLQAWTGTGLPLTENVGVSVAWPPSSRQSVTS
jgi:hypothetical protein